MTSHTVSGTEKTREQVLEEALVDLIAQFKTPGDDGELVDIEVAIADFNGFYGGCFIGRLRWFKYKYHKCGSGEQVHG